MLTWAGKQPLQHVASAPVHHSELFDPAGDAQARDGAAWQGWPPELPRGGLLFQGDNRQVLAHLLERGLRGKIDLVYAHADRFHVLDYKSNRLTSYDHDTLAAAMDDSEYTLQALLYTLALHRWLRFRLGKAYDYDAHVGGIRYLFCRGLDASDPARPGVHAWQPPRALIEGLDALFGHAPASVEAEASA